MGRGSVYWHPPVAGHGDIGSGLAKSGHPRGGERSPFRNTQIKIVVRSVYADLVPICVFGVCASRVVLTGRELSRFSVGWSRGGIARGRHTQFVSPTVHLSRAAR
eukprot:8672627-Pyramimonas_sp.AAC.1